MTLLVSGAVDVTTFTPNNVKISFVRGSSIKLSKEFSKLNNECKKVY